MEFEKLQIEKILSFIPSPYQPIKLEVFDSIDSTNTYLLNQIKQKAPSGWVCFAEEQTKGRGRRGRTWFSPSNGNLYCSLLWHFEKTEQLSGLSIAIGVILTYLLEHYGKTESLRLKWPNDVLFHGKKLAGILLETVDSKNIVIGIGINWIRPAEYNAIGLSDILPDHLSRNEFAAKLIHMLFYYLPILSQSGIGAFVKDWRKYDYLFGENISLMLPDKEIEGTMRGINEKGELILKTSQGEQCFCYGEASVKKHYLP